MSITYELSEDEFEAVRDAMHLVGLVEALAATSSNRIDINRAELCAFTTVVIGKLRDVLGAAETRREAERALIESRELTPTQKIIEQTSARPLAVDTTHRGNKRARREAVAAA